MSAERVHAPMPFTIGSPSSGTTLLRRTFDAHLALMSMPPETGFFALGRARSDGPGDALAQFGYAA